MTIVAKYVVADPRLRVVLAPRGAGKSFLVRCFDAGDDFDPICLPHLSHVLRCTPGDDARRILATKRAAIAAMYGAVNSRCGRVQFTSGTVAVDALLRARALSADQVLIWLPKRSLCDRTVFCKISNDYQVVISNSNDLSDYFTLMTLEPK